MEEEQLGEPGPSSLAYRRASVPPKVSQIDAEDLDESLVDMLGDRVHRSLGNFGPSAAQDWKPEISLLLKLLIFRCGVCDPLRSSSPGSALQNMRLSESTRYGLQRPTRQKLLLYLLLHPPIFPTYIITRIRSYGLSKQWPDLPARDVRRRLWKLLLFLESFAKAWELAGWTAFLLDPRYPSLLMRILKLRLIPSSPHLTRLISYEFSNRQLVWSAFTEFLMFAVPLLPSLPPSLSPSRHINAVRALLTRPKTVDYTSIPLLQSSHGSTNGAVKGTHSGPFADLPLNTCPICHQRRKTTPAPIGESSSAAEIILPPVDVSGGEDEEMIFVPAQTDCWGGCRWCYYCIAGELARHADLTAKAEEEEGKGKKQASKVETKRWDCLRCGGQVTRAWRVGAEMVEDEVKIDSEDVHLDDDAEASISSSIVIV